MKSLTIGIVREGTANDYALNKTTNYISMYGTRPEITFNIKCGQHEFLQKVDELRYKDADPDASANAILFFQDLTTKLISDLQYVNFEPGDNEPLHLRLVARPLELAQIPFEFALTPGIPEKVPLLTNPARMISFTRELRQETEANYKWPSIPRILFAWAQPTDEVPFAEHRQALISSLESLVVPKAGIPYPEPDTQAFITEIPNASLKGIGAALEKGAEDGRPYTHLNILAHGGQQEVFSVKEFRIILCLDGDEKGEDNIDGDRLITELQRGKENGMPTLITLAVCDSGNTGNTFSPSGSLVYNLHKAGIPCVIASQFPLTQEGSVIMVKTLYQDLVNACDPRVALYKTRMALKEDSYHDWASLVAYARFPENINEQLQEAELKVVFESMKTTNIWVDHIFHYWNELPVDKREKALFEVSQRHEQSILRLTWYVEENKEHSNLLTPSLKAEHLGLIGSSYKRKAEYLHRLSKINPEQAETLKQQSVSALQTAQEFYYRGFDASIENHWTAMQYLSLKTFTEESRADNRELWTIIKFMAERAAGRSREVIWAWTTLAELYMLQPFSSPDAATEKDLEAALATAKEYMKKFNTAVGENHTAEKESTARQLERYMVWWPKMFPDTFPKELIRMATELRAMLPSVEQMLS